MPTQSTSYRCRLLLVKLAHCGQELLLNWAQHGDQIAVLERGAKTCVSIMGTCKQDTRTQALIVVHGIRYHPLCDAPLISFHERPRSSRQAATGKFHTASAVVSWPYLPKIRTSQVGQVYFSP